MKRKRKQIQRNLEQKKQKLEKCSILDFPENLLFEISEYFNLEDYYVLAIASYKIFSCFAKVVRNIMQGEAKEVLDSEILKTFHFPKLLTFCLNQDAMISKIENIDFLGNCEMLLGIELINVFALRNYPLISKMENLKKLTRLTVNYTLFDKNDFKKIVMLQNLKKLNLDHTDVDDDDLKCISKLKNLVVLCLRFTNIIAINSIKKLKKLELLDISNTAVNQFDTISNLKNLREFYCEDTSFTDNNLMLLSNLNHLRILSLAGTLIKTPDWKHLCNLKKLAAMDLSDTKIKILVGIDNLQSLRILDLSDCDKINNDQIQYIYPLKNLRKLRLGMIQEADNILDHFSKLQHLTFLHLPEINILQEFKKKIPTSSENKIPILKFLSTFTNKNQ